MIARSLLPGLVVAGVLSMVSCGAGAGQPGRAVESFYAAAIRGDSVAAENVLASRHRGQGREIIGTATRGGTLSRVEIASTDVWAEHGAVCEVRRTFSNGTTDVVRIEVTREGGDWKIASGTPDGPNR